MLNQRHRDKQSHQGFSLLESVFVLTIVALAVGAITVGANVMENGKLRKQINQIELLESGIQNFRNKYNCLPGDCIDPTVISGYTYTGNGNGFLEPAWNGNESKGFWVHLTASKMLVETLYAHPALASMNTPKSVINPKAYLNVYGDINYSQNIIEFATDTVSGALQMEQIKHIDKKMDDGLPDRGSIRSSGYGTGATTIYAAAPTFPLSSSNKNGTDKCVSGGVYDQAAAYDECNMLYVSETR